MVTGPALRQRPEREDPQTCDTISDMLARVGDKWSLLVVSTLGDGPFGSMSYPAHWGHQPEDALLDPQSARARWHDHPNRCFDGPAAGRIRAHESWSGVARSGLGPRAVDEAKHLANYRGESCLRRQDGGHRRPRNVATWVRPQRCCFRSFLWRLDTPDTGP